MTLDKSKLKGALEAIATDFNLPEDDEDSVWFGHDMTAAEAAGLWADAVADYAADVTQGGTGAALGRDPLAAALAVAFATASAAAAMETAFATFAAAVATGMASSTPVPFTATPPAAPVGFATLFAAPAASSAAAATVVSDAIHTWMKTGSATPNTPPGAGSTLWS